MKIPIYIVDMRTSLPDKPCYPVGAMCKNCGIFHVALFSYGQPKGQEDRCPYCRCNKTVSYMATMDAVPLLDSTDRERHFVAWGDGGLMKLPDAYVVGIEEPIVPPRTLVPAKVYSAPVFAPND